MANIGLLSEITAFGMFLIIVQKYSLELLIKTQTKFTLLKIKIQASPNDRFGINIAVE